MLAFCHQPARKTKRGFLSQSLGLDFLGCLIEWATMVAPNLADCTSCMSSHGHFRYRMRFWIAKSSQGVGSRDSCTEFANCQVDRVCHRSRTTPFFYNANTKCRRLLFSRCAHRPLMTITTKSATPRFLSLRWGDHADSAPAPTRAQRGVPERPACEPGSG